MAKLDDCELPIIKTCFGAARVARETDYYGDRKKEYLQIYWSDGTVWDEYCSVNRPRPLAAEELWIQEAIEKFQRLLAGRETSFTIDFLDGGKFVGKYGPKDKKSHHEEGEYKVNLTLERGKVKEGSFYFKPTPEAPTIEDSLYQQAEKAGKKIVSIDAVIRVKRSAEGRKWAGVYSNPY